MVSLFVAVLLIQLVIYIVNAVGAKTINELVWSGHSTTPRTDEKIVMAILSSAAVGLIK